MKALSNQATIFVSFLTLISSSCQVRSHNKEYPTKKSQNLTRRLQQRGQSPTRTRRNQSNPRREKENKRHYVRGI